jgi:hypothetical protein
MESFKRIGMVAVLFFILISSPRARANDWEFWSGPLMDLSLSSSDTYFRFLTQQNQSIKPSLGYIFQDKYQIKISPSYYYNNKSSRSSSELNLMGGINYSFFGSFDDSYFLEAQLGISKSKVATSANTTKNSHLAFLFSTGKRFKMTSQILYAPAMTFYYKDRNSNGSATSIFSFIPVQFTFVL